MTVELYTVCRMPDGKYYKFSDAQLLMIAKEVRYQIVCCALPYEIADRIVRENNRQSASVNSGLKKGN